MVQITKEPVYTIVLIRTVLSKNDTYCEYRSITVVFNHVIYLYEKCGSTRRNQVDSFIVGIAYNIVLV